MTKQQDEELLISIDESFGLTKYDFNKGIPIYTKWGGEDSYTDIENLGHKSLKIGKNLGDVYFDWIKTDGWVIVGKGTTLHCDNISAGRGVVENFEGFLM